MVFKGISQDGVHYGECLDEKRDDEKMRIQERILRESSISEQREKSG